MRRKKTVMYVSEADKFIAEFDQSHAPSQTQLAEITKYKKIAELRDKPSAAEEKSGIWEGF
jgi:hypothetical protein